MTTPLPARAASVVGRPTSRVEARLKVTGAARYPTETPVDGVAHAAIVSSAVGRGRIAAIDSRAAEAAPGVLGVLTHRNAPRLREPPPTQAGGPGGGYDPFALRLPEGKGLLQDDVVHHSGQHVAVVVADTLERAQDAAALVQVAYAAERPAADFDEALARAYAPEGREPPPRGDADAALATAAVRVDALYATPTEHHNALGLFGAIAWWEGPDRLVVHDTTQGVYNARNALAAAFGLPLDNVRVTATFVGGGFGSGLRAWPHTTLAAMAARHVGRPVKLVLTRRQMFTAIGYRNPSRQRLALGADRDGRLTAIVHEATTPTNRFQTFGGGLTDKARTLYACPNVRTETLLVPLDLSKATPMRAPGTAEGVFALESAMDELAYAAGVDPIELRLRNHAEVDPEEGRPWSSKSLRECYRIGAERFGWSRRAPEPRLMRDGRWLVGYGMASTAYEARRLPAAARVTFQADGGALVENAATDIGPGTYTALALVAAEALGVPIERVRVTLADSRLPHAPVQGGSFLLASTAAAVHEASLAACARLVALARSDGRSPLRNRPAEAIASADGRLFLAADPSVGEEHRHILARHGLEAVEGEADTRPAAGGGGAEGPASYSFGAQFVEVRVDPDLGEVRVPRVVGVYGAGRIVNPRTARSQMIGGVIGGLGMALMEETRIDRAYGRYTNTGLADYLVPVHADAPDIDVVFLDETDTHLGPVGAKGLGELPIVGVAPAIANAVFHATGRRVRDLPITPEKLLA